MMRSRWTARSRPKRLLLGWRVTESPHAREAGIALDPALRIEPGEGQAMMRSRWTARSRPKRLLLGWKVTESPHAREAGIALDPALRIEPGEGQAMMRRRLDGSKPSEASA